MFSFLDIWLPLILVTTELGEYEALWVEESQMQINKNCLKDKPMVAMRKVSGWVLLLKMNRLK